MTDAGAPADGAGTRRAVLEWREPDAMYASDAALTGLGYIQGLVSGEILMPPVAQVLGMRVLATEPGWVRFSMPVRAQFTNHLGYLAGGILATGLDAALGCAVLSSLGAEQDIVTLDLHVDFLRPASGASGDLDIVAEVAHAGRNRAVALGRVGDASGRLCAIGRGSCLLRPKAGSALRTPDGQEAGT